MIDQIGPITGQIGQSGNAQFFAPLKRKCTKYLFEIAQRKEILRYEVHQDTLEALRYTIYFNNSDKCFHVSFYRHSFGLNATSVNIVIGLERRQNIVTAFDLFQQIVVKNIWGHSVEHIMFDTLQKLIPFVYEKDGIGSIVAVRRATADEDFHHRDIVITYKLYQKKATIDVGIDCKASLNGQKRFKNEHPDIPSFVFHKLYCNPDFARELMLKIATIANAYQRYKKYKTKKHLEFFHM